MSLTTTLILPHGSGNLPLFSLTVQGICQNISMWRTEHGKNTPISNKVMAHSSSHTNQIHSNSGARANTHHNALSGVHMAQPRISTMLNCAQKPLFITWRNYFAFISASLAFVLLYTIVWFPLCINFYHFHVCSHTHKANSYSIFLCFCQFVNSYLGRFPFQKREKSKEISHTHLLWFVTFVELMR